MAWRSTLFRDRQEAGERLVPLLRDLGLDRPIVYGLLRGGAAVAAPIAAALGAPLQPFLVRKLGVPWQPELAFGALAEGAAEPVLNQDVVTLCGLTPAQMSRIQAEQAQELARRQAVYLHGRERLDPRGRAAILVDDGLATGASARAALRALRGRGAAPLILAIPVAPRESIDSLSAEADRIVCAEVSSIPFGIGGCYGDFHQLEDEEVLALLAAAEGPPQP
ncbi:phosphoribosyltransferase [Roseomonas eburnea]|uniref:Phosphoribosyltransferase n=1 Tax=Neoroseomonas eburnea TaxID=1346889 RepID=A0A9X9X5C7_9PROT|nr:phosphoribosyltransferase family protein [Neoroseomonas eburnea]MBR0678913.1 phosphoribosyltransferase [Neoroseomonas eburnea]